MTHKHIHYFIIIITLISVYIITNPNFVVSANLIDFTGDYSPPSPPPPSPPPHPPSLSCESDLRGRPHITWKEKKAMENRKVVSLGGKAPKKQGLPLSVARVMMKKQKERDKKTLQENMILGQVGGNRGNRSKRTSDSRKPEDRVLMSTAGRFRNGVLDVKVLLKSSRDRGSSSRNGLGGGSFNDGLGGGSGGRGSGKGGKKGGKKKGGKKGDRRKGH